MADLFQITPPTIRAEGKDVPPEQIQAGFNSLARQTQNALNTVGSDPTGPAGGDLSGAYPNPTVAAVHATSGTLDGVVIGGTTPAAAAVTTLTANTAIAVTSGGTGANALNAHNVIIGEGSSAVGFAAPGTAGNILASNGAAADPSFQTKAALTIASSGANSDITSLSGLTTALSVGQGGTGRQTLTSHGVLIGEAAAAINQTAVGTTGQMLLGVTGADPAFGNNPVITGGTIDNAVIGGATRAAGHFTTLDTTTAIAVGSGGTGATTLTAHGVLLGEGTSAITAAAVGTTGQMLLGVTGADPAFGGNPTITGGTIDGAVIGGTTPAAGTFTSLSSTTLAKVEAQNTSGQSIANNSSTTVTNWTVTNQIGSAFVASTGVFTAPATAYYMFSFHFRMTLTTPPINTILLAILAVAGTDVANGVTSIGAATETIAGCQVNFMKKLTSGQTVTLQAYQNSGSSATLSSGAADCFASIYQLP